jgi:predicted acylesterase/phospholipase RssA
MIGRAMLTDSLTNLFDVSWSSTAPRRSLILAGGGLKVAYQAGVLQVWLDEAGITFDHADGASGGVFNLAMYCQGLSGKEIADSWRDFPVLSAIALDWRQCLKLIWAKSLLSYSKFRRVILRDRWKLDWETIRSSPKDGTFNAYDFNKQQVVVRTQDQADEDFLVAGVSLPGWFSPVKDGESLLIDAVYLTDANLIEAIRRQGADELWIIWTVNKNSRWRGGPINTYFQVIETVANGNLNRDLDRIKANNDAFKKGDRGEFGRRIDVKILIGRVRLHYLLNFRSRRFTAAVEQGIADAREWCSANRIPLKQVQSQTAKRIETVGSVSESPSIIVGGKFDPHLAPVNVQNERVIDATPERIWGVLIKAAHWPKWYPNSRSVHIEGGGLDLYPKAEFSWITFGVCLRSIIREFSPHERIAWTAKFVGVDAYHAWQIERIGQRSRVITEETQYGCLARAQDYLLPNRMYDGHQLWLEMLAREVER